MDLDAYTAAHAQEWRRLEQLGGLARPTAAQADELLDLYQRVATHLSVVRSAAPDPATVAYLSWLLSRARTRAAGVRPRRLAAVPAFFLESFPAALYRTRRWWLLTAAVNVAVALALGWWFLANPAFESALASATDLNQLVNNDFESYYSENAASSFAFKVWTNNAWVSALCVALGVLGLPVVYLLWSNVLNLALVGSIMVNHGRGGLFFGLILPHGLLELTAVFVAGGTGLRLFWAWIEPGPQTRSAAVGREGRSAAGVAAGLAAVLAVSGGIEAFVTPSGLPTWGRVAVGLLAEAAFLAYVFTLGRAAHRRGSSGDVGLDQASAQAPARA